MTTLMAFLAYMAVGSVVTGVMNSARRMDAADRFVWTAAWPLVLAALAIMWAIEARPRWVGDPFFALGTWLGRRFGGEI